MTGARRITDVSDITSAQGRLVLPVHGANLDINFTRTAARTDVLLVGFHGSVNRETRQVPAFSGLIPGAGTLVHQLMIADPSLRMGDQLGMAWYAGDHAFRSQEILGPIICAAADALRASRVIYFGSSGGGFAALYYSWQHPGSLALVGNPQTNIERYYSGYRRRYLAACWPGIENLDELEGLVTTNLLKQYATGMENSVIYLQNPTDHFHLINHAAPFLSAIQEIPAWKKLVFESIWPGKFGHFPIWSMFAPWLQAAVAARSWTADDLTETKHRIVGVSQPALPVSDRTPSARYSANDLEKADLLRDYQLRANGEV